MKQKDLMGKNEEGRRKSVKRKRKKEKEGRTRIKYEKRRTKEK